MKRADVSGYGVFCGIDVGKGSHRCVALAPDGETVLLERRVGQDEAELAALFADLAAIGPTLAVVDQHAGFGALVASCARAAGAGLASVAPSRFARIAAVTGECKTDASDALELARLPIEAPRHLDWAPEPGEEAAEAACLLRYRHDMVRERTRAYNRLHDALNRLCPALERLLAGNALHALHALLALSRHGVAGLAAARPRDLERWALSQKGLGPAAAGGVARMREAARSQARALPGAGALDLQVRADAARIVELERLVDDLSERVGELCEDVPAVAVARTMPGVGEVWSRTIALEVGDVSRFASAAKLAAYCGVGRRPDDSGARVRSRGRRSYNRRLREAMFESARMAIRRPGPDLDYYEKKLAGDMNRHQALHALVRKRVSIMYAMLRNMEPYRAA